MAKDKSNRADAVRTAVDQAFQAAAGQAQVTRERAQELVDELSGAAGRLRDVLEDLRPPSTDEVRDLREEVRALAERVAKLEAAARAAQARAAPAPAEEGRRARMAEPSFRSSAEFREVMDRVFTMMSEDPDDGPEAARRRRARSASSSRTSTWS